MEITTELKDLVIKEATNLKKYAHADELAKLDFSSFSGTTNTRCIYGQITGDCLSQRASELIMSCCDRVFSPQRNNSVCLNGPRESALNGKPEQARVMYEYYSPIEVFIYEDNKSKAKPIIDFLKGETETLTL